MTHAHKIDFDAIPDSAWPRKRCHHCQGSGQGAMCTIYTYCSDCEGTGVYFAVRSNRAVMVERLNESLAAILADSDEYWRRSCDIAQADLDFVGSDIAGTFLRVVHSVAGPQSRAYVYLVAVARRDRDKQTLARRDRDKHRSRLYHDGVQYRSDPELAFGVLKNWFRKDPVHYIFCRENSVERDREMTRMRHALPPAVFAIIETWYDAIGQSMSDWTQRHLDGEERADD